MTYPLNVEWAGGLRVPAYGAYRLSLGAPAGATLEIDGRQVITATSGSSVPAEVRVVLASGVHQVRLAGTLQDPQTPVQLQWSTDTGIYVPVARPFLWSGPPGTLLARAYPPIADPTWLTNLQFAGLPATPLIERRDGVLAWRGINGSIGGFSGPAVLWTGTLRAPVAGAYGLEAATPGRVSIWVDGQKVDPGNGVQVPNMGAGVQLGAGDHAIEIHLQVDRDGTPFDLYWQPPGGQREIMPPTAFAPATGGVLLADERPGAPSVDAALITAAPPVVQMRLTGEIKGDWQEARGVAVLPDGRVVVGDTGHHRLLVYGADGKQQAAWGSEGSGPGQFMNLSDVAAGADGTIAALDAGNGDVQLFSADGKPAGHLTHDQLGIMQSSGIAWGLDGQIYIGDTAGARVLRASRDGQQLAGFREGDSRHAPIDQALDVVATVDGTMYAVDLRHRVVRITAAGLIDHEWVVPVGAERGGSHLALWGGYLAITNPEGNNLSLMDLSTGVLHSVALSGPALNLAMPVGVAAGPDGRLYVLDSNNNRVVILEAVP
jgi:hypothetical protein